MKKKLAAADKKVETGWLMYIFSVFRIKLNLQKAAIIKEQLEIDVAPEIPGTGSGNQIGPQAYLLVVTSYLKGR